VKKAEKISPLFISIRRQVSYSTSIPLDRSKGKREMEVYSC